MTSRKPVGDDAATDPATLLPPWRQAVTLQMLSWGDTLELLKVHRGKIVVVDVWSTACEPCLREFPRFVELQNAYGSDVVCVGLNCDYAGVRKKPPEYYRDRVLNVLASKEAKVLNVMCTDPADELFTDLKIDSIPAVFVYDRDGSLVATFDNRTTEMGEFTYDEHVVPALLKILNPTTAATSPRLR